MNEIVIAVISGGASLLVCLVNNIFQSKKSRKEAFENMQLVNYKIDELSKRVEKHNNVIERVYKLEAKVDGMGGKLK